ncbi:SRPBCC family protein [Luteibacter aegosomatissinici]|uniref:SRPBCC family protein n=1 Tax=Luteibacter aegosomatissinici TaxID=2911539 RepID=UPI001FF7ABB0|nr:SRPBCC domain-containing protein [Luteibacter aegosomatissinici]UPG92875.1 SRPBCC domain-containing protein [Luteibacter aegosomatissinici]
MARVTVTHYFPYPAERVFDAWLDQDTVGQWLFATPDGEMVEVALHPQVGGSYRIVERRENVNVLHTGIYERIDPPHDLAFSFAVPMYDPGSVHVQIHIAAVPGGCNLTLTHEVQEQWLKPSTQGWQTILSNLESTL